MALAVRGAARVVLLNPVNVVIAKIARDDQPMFQHRRQAINIRLAK
jgi:hypothetical protein